MLNKSFGVIYFHFNIYREKKAKKMGFKICIFLGLKNLFQNGPFHTSSAIIDTSMFFLIRLIDEAGRRTFQLNE